MFEQLQFESGLSHNIFQSRINKSRQLLSASILSFIAKQVVTMKIFINIESVLLKGTTLMDVSIQTSFPIENLQRIHKVSIQLR